MKRIYNSFDPTITVYEVLQELNDRLERYERRLDGIDEDLSYYETALDCNEDEYNDLLKRSVRLSKVISDTYDFAEELAHIASTLSDF